MNPEKYKAQKERHEAIKEIKKRMAAGEPTTFAERNIVKIYDKKVAKRKKYQDESLKSLIEQRHVIMVVPSGIGKSITKNK